MTSSPLLQCLRDRTTAMRYSGRTTQAYSRWVRQYVRFHRMRHPRELGGESVREFLTHLARDRMVAASTQNQALAALQFLCKRPELPCHRWSGGGRMLSEVVVGESWRVERRRRGVDYCGHAAPNRSRQRSGRRSVTGTCSRSLRSTSVNYGSGGTSCCAQVRISE